jgi:uncharacterized membrane protein YhhN
VGFPAPTMSKITSRIGAVAVAVGALLAMVGHVRGPLWLSLVFTPLTTLLLVLIVLSQWLEQGRIFALWITIGLVFSVCGDALLVWPEQYFDAGLAAFLCTHLAYLMALTRETKFPANLPIWVLYLFATAGSGAILWSEVPASLRIPVVLYSIFLSTMAAQAMGRWIALRSRAAQRAAIGAFFFMTSDTLLAIDRFRVHIPAAAIFVLGTYFIGQWLIASSTWELGPA